MTSTADASPDSESVTADTEAIKLLKARYFRFVDTKDWSAFRELFVADARLDFPGEGGTFDGVDAFIERVGPNLEDIVTVHHGHMPEIVFTGPDTAEGIFAMEDRLRYPDGHKLESMHGWGHYHDTFGRTANGWRITSVRLSRLARDLVRRDPAPS